MTQPNQPEKEPSLSAILVPPCLRNTNRSTLKIWAMCAGAAAFIYGTMNWGQYGKEDRDLSAMEPSARATSAAHDVDIWEEQPLVFKIALLGSYLGAKKHDTREPVEDKEESK